MKKSELPFQTVRDLSKGIRTGAVSSVDVTEEVLERIERLNPKLNAYITILREQAVKAAEAADREIKRGMWRGPLHGVPLALKDLFYTKGIRTTAGSKVLSNFYPSYDATCVKRLREAGAIIVGKTNLHEFAFGATNVNPHYGTARNPWNIERIAGGSSGGSAVALAAGMCSATLGSDTAGSIRIPAACCGVVGFKPTYGMVSRHGVVPLSWTNDHVGPLARSAWDAAAVLQVIAGPDPSDPSTENVPVRDYLAALESPPKRFTVGVPKHYFLELLAQDVEGAYWRAVEVLEELGGKRVEVSFKYAPHLSIARFIITLSEAASYHEHPLLMRWTDYGEEVRLRIAMGLFLPSSYYLKAQRARRLLSQKYLLEVAKKVNVLACPTIPVPAPKIGAEKVDFNGASEGIRKAMIRLTEPFNPLGVPVVTLPCGFSGDGLPLSLQLAGRPFEDSRLLAIAHLYERATDWTSRRPGL